MSLSDYTPERHEVVMKKGSFSVTGLSLNDLAQLLKTHFTEMETVFGLFEGSVKVDNIDMARLTTSLIREAPGLTANIIALAAGEPGAAGAAAALPFPAQLECLQAIGRMTFEEVGGVKKSIEIMTNMLGLLGRAK